MKTGRLRITLHLSRKIPEEKSNNDAGTTLHRERENLILLNRYEEANEIKIRSPQLPMSQHPPAALKATAQQR